MLDLAGDEAVMVAAVRRLARDRVPRRTPTVRELAESNLRLHRAHA